MTRAELEHDVKHRFGMEIDELIRQKVEVDTLHDHEIAHLPQRTSIKDLQVEKRLWNQTGKWILEAV